MTCTLRYIVLPADSPLAVAALPTQTAQEDVLGEAVGQGNPVTEPVQEHLVATRAVRVTQNTCVASLQAKKEKKTSSATLAFFSAAVYDSSYATGYAKDEEIQVQIHNVSRHRF